MSMAPHDTGFSPRGFFVTGTDTGVGKSLVACALLHAYAARGLRVVGMKPVAAGAEQRNGVWINDDVEQLVAAGNVAAPREHVNPYCFEPPIAPHIAAELDNKTIEIKGLLESYQQLSTLAEIVVVEGAGGFCVPLNASQSSADLAQRLGLPVVLVVGMRLGCLNHALLTAEAVRARGLRLAGWVANHIESAMPYAAENVAALLQRLDAPLLVSIPYGAHTDVVGIAERFKNL